MFGKKNQTSQIDKEQLEYLQNAQDRIKQKKRLYTHFVVFLIGSMFFIVADLVFGIGKDTKILNTNWFVVVIAIWLFFLIYHVFNVFVTDQFLGKKWEKQQLDKLISQQSKRVEEMKQQILNEERLKAHAEAQKEIQSVTLEKKNPDSIV